MQSVNVDHLYGSYEINVSAICLFEPKAINLLVPVFKVPCFNRNDTLSPPGKRTLTDFTFNLFISHDWEVEVFKLVKTDRKVEAEHQI
jgi:hypothetical protein